MRGVSGRGPSSGGVVSLASPACVSSSLVLHRSSPKKVPARGFPVTIPSNKLLSLYASEPDAARRVADWDAARPPRRNDGRSASTSKAYDEVAGSVHPLLRVSPLKSSPATIPSCSYSLFPDLSPKKERRSTTDYPDYLDFPQQLASDCTRREKKDLPSLSNFPGVFPLVRASPFGGGLTNGTPVKKRRSSSSPEDSSREKIPHLDQQQPSTSTGITGNSTGSSKKDVNLTAELFWLKTQLAEQWPIKWLWQVSVPFPK